MAITHATVLGGSDNPAYPISKNAWNAALLGNGLGMFNVMSYGAVGDATTNDTAAFQAAIDAACQAHGTLVIPTASVWYNISDTLTIQPGTDVPSMAVMHILASGDTAGIMWTGASNKPLFKSIGWRNSTISGLHLKTALSESTVMNLTAWEITTSAVAQSSTHLLFEGCRVNMDGLGTGTIGWRLGHDRDGDLSAITWLGCMVQGKSPLGAAENGIGWAIETPNALQLQWLGCFGNNLAKKLTSVPTAGAASGIGGGSLFFFGDGGAWNALEFEYQRKGQPILISGGRWENGTTFLSTNNSADPTLSVNATIAGGCIEGFTADTLFSFLSSGSLTLDGLAVGTAGARAAYPATLVNLGTGAAIGSLNVRGGSYEAGATIHTVASGTWAVDIVGALRQDVATNVIGAIARLEA